MQLGRAVSVSQMQAIDRQAIEVLGIPRVVLMDHAGFAAAKQIHQCIPANSKILIVCGMGFNGGDGLSCARHLQSLGHIPQILLSHSSDKLRPDCQVFFHIVEQLRLPFRVWSSDVLAQFDSVQCVVDALLGIGLQGEVRSHEHGIIEGVQRMAKPVYALDVPSGMDADSGEPLGVAMKANMTVTFGLGKKGFFTESGKRYVGELVVDSITFPEDLLRH